MERVSAPTQSPVIMSSTPSQRDKPIPAPIAIEQIGHIARAFEVMSKFNNRTKKEKEIIFFIQGSLYHKVENCTVLIYNQKITKRG